MNKLTTIYDFHAVAARRRAPKPALICAWRRDPITGALVCRWTVRRGGQDRASDVPLCLAA